MKSLTTFLTEATTGEEKLTHLEHAEDHPINAGHAGFKHAFDTLHNTHELLAGRKSKASVTTKFDGSPSVVFGTNPENGKFFVASKSAFNATPKLNYTHEDIEKNHGHAPGLVSKLKAALTHLPKVAPKEGIYQGDFMYHKDDGDVREEDGKFHFKPNTITYSTKANSEEGKKIANSKIGVVVHTAYHGSTLAKMKAEYNAKLDKFKDHKDVRLISPQVDHTNAKYTKEMQKEFTTHMQNAIEANERLKNYSHLAGHEEHVKTYINKKVREGGPLSVAGYSQHLQDHYKKKADALKTPAGKQGHIQRGAEMVAHAQKNSKHFDTTFEVHKQLQKAKNVLVNALSHQPTFEHRVGGQKVKPEGFVATINNRPTKLVDRDEFSRLNFLQSRER